MIARALLIALILVLGTIASSFAATGPNGIPLYPGSKINTETNMTNKDFLPVVRQWMLVMPEILKSILQSEPGMINDSSTGAIIDQLKSALSEESMKELEHAVSSLESVSTIDYKLPKGATSEKVSDFYMQKLGLTKGWTLTLRTEMPFGSLRLYTKADFESFFGFITVPGGVSVFRTKGKVDLLPITKWMTKVIPMLFYFRAQSTEVKPDTEPAPVPMPVPEQQ